MFGNRHTKPLFQNGIFLHNLVGDRERRVDKAVRALSGDILRREDLNVLADKVLESHAFKAPVVDYQNLSVSRTEVDIDVSRDPRRNIFNRPGPMMKRGTRLNLHVPFTGDGELFFVQPTSYSLSPMPQGYVTGAELVIQFQLLDEDAAFAKREVEKAQSILKSNLNTLSMDAEKANSALRSRAIQRLQQRQQAQRKGDEVVDAIGLPIRGGEAG